MNLLVVRPYLCTGCRTCELACAFAHPGGSAGLPGRSRVSVRAAGDGAHVPLLCQQCNRAMCVSSCAYGALARSSDTGAIELDVSRCTLCMLCTAACPFGNIELDSSRQEIVKCDLCRGDPACARFCPSGTLTFVPAAARTP